MYSSVFTAALIAIHQPLMSEITNTITASIIPDSAIAAMTCT